MAEERARIAAATVALIGSRGYRQTSLEQILAAAAVDEDGFARHFASKEECFVAVWDELNAAYGVLAARAFAAAGPWRERIRTVAWITLDYLQADLARTRFLVLEVLNAGEIAQAHRDLAIAAEVEMIDAGREESTAELSRATAEHLAGAVNEMLIRRARSGEIQQGARVLRELMYMTVRPYLGEEAALEELSIDPPQRILG